MRVLIIGGTGLISTSITSQLIERGDDVTLYNRGKSEDRTIGGAKTIHGDRREYPAFIQEMRALEPFDTVIDMICFSPADAESLVEAFRGSAKQIIFCSTVCVYGGPAQSYPIREDEERRPTGGYGANKVKCEDIMMAAGRDNLFQVTIMRPSQSYGEGGTIVHSMGGSALYIDRLRKGKPIIVHGDGACLWAACHVDDVARGFVGAVMNPASYGKSYNLTGEEWMTWNRYHEKVAAAIGAPAPKLVHIPTDLLARISKEKFNISVEIFQFPSIFDNSAAIRDLGFKYTISWEQGVKRTVAWLDAHEKIGDSSSDDYEDRVIAAWNKHTAEIVNELNGS